MRKPHIYKESLRGKSEILLERELRQALIEAGCKDGGGTVERKRERIKVSVEKEDELRAIRVVARLHPEFKHKETVTGEKVNAVFLKGKVFIEFRT